MNEAESAFTVELVREDGSADVLEVSPDETILQATDPTDIDMRYGCREGRCVSCTGLLLDGDVEYETEPVALNEHQRGDGFVLLCIAHPAADCRVRVGKSVLGAAFPSIWRSESTIDPDLVELEQATKELERIDDVDVSGAHLEEMRGAMEYFDNLHEVREAYRRALETTRERRYH